ncbi:hypothetical protein N9R78_00360 [Pelagibacteraceae bacterium]|nr:hypothetical protein [Pelagibacteraceae bacterium]
MNPIKEYKFNFYIIFSVYCLLIIFGTSIVQSDDSKEILLNADSMKVTNDGNKIIANDNITIQTNELISKADSITYNKIKDEFIADGNVSVLDNLGNNYYFDTFVSDKDFNNAIGSNIKIKLKNGARIVGNQFSRSNSKTNQIDNAIYTPCLKKNYSIKNCPGWKMSSKKVIHDLDKKTLYYEGAVLSILNVPVLYSPYFSHPDPSVKKRTGILMPKITSDNILGTSFSLPFFYNIASNKDLTITPTIQSKADDYYSFNYRQLTKNHKINIDSSITNNESKTGTKNHIFINGGVKNPYGKFVYRVETSNNDTYLRKNQINDLTIHTSGLNFTKETDNSYLDFNSYIYKHLNNPENEKWEYVYPNINYNINNFKDPFFNRDWLIENSLLNYRNIQKQTEQQLSNELKNVDKKISYNTGLIFENTIQNRLVYIKKNVDNFSQLRIFPQISSKVSYPMSKPSANLESTQTLEPIIMPILSPFNNYTEQKSIDSSSLFSLNRASSLTEWEDGPRVNYGLNWLINSSNININTLIGQSFRANKEKNSSDSEVSDFFIGNTIDVNKIGYLATDLTIERTDLYVKDYNINSLIELKKIKFAFDYAYNTNNKVKLSEQISAGIKIQLDKDINFIASARKDLMTDKSFGNAIGLHYENDCLAINFDYFKDFTVVDDIKNSRGFSFTITLKPFGSSKNYGKVKNFGPSL